MKTRTTAGTTGEPSGAHLSPRLACTLRSEDVSASSRLEGVAIRTDRRKCRGLTALALAWPHASLALDASFRCGGIDGERCRTRLAVSKTGETVVQRGGEAFQSTAASAGRLDGVDSPFWRAIGVTGRGVGRTVELRRKADLGQCCRMSSGATGRMVNRKQGIAVEVVWSDTTLGIAATHQRRGRHRSWNTREVSASRESGQKNPVANCGGPCSFLSLHGQAKLSGVDSHKSTAIPQVPAKFLEVA